MGMPRRPGAPPVDGIHGLGCQETHDQTSVRPSVQGQGKGPKPQKLEREISIAMYYVARRASASVRVQTEICKTPRPFRALHLILFRHFFSLFDPCLPLD